jgi:membrane-bound metal-dependent hydrolase YbcI (DUF457 family)
MAVIHGTERFSAAQGLMFAAHFAAGVAIKSQVPETPIRPLLTAVFLPDLVWIALAAVGVEPAAPDHFFDGWSHSLAMILLYALVVAFAYRRSGRAVSGALFVAVLSHFALDVPIHPKPLELYPHSAVRFDLHLGTVDSMRYWILQLLVIAVLLGIYIVGMHRLREARARTIQTCVGVLALHALLLPA